MSRDEQSKAIGGGVKRTRKSDSRDVISSIDGWLEVVTLALMCGILVLLGYVLW
jgi:hypothetical protein